MNNEEANKLKWRLPPIKTLTMLKMEKNFIAVIEKKYPRQPYIEYPLGFLVKRLHTEFQEFCEAYLKNDIQTMKEEIADVENILEYIFEKLSRLETEKDITLTSLFAE